SVWADVQLIAAATPATRGKVILFYPKRKPWRNFLVGIGKNANLGLEITVQELLRVFNLQFFTSLGQTGRVFVAHRMIADFVSLTLNLSPFVQPSELGDSQKERAPQLPLVQRRNSLIELHTVGVVEGERHGRFMPIPRQHHEPWRL